MTVKIRLARAGAKKRPFYKVVAANSDSPRDGIFLEKLGTYDPMLAKGDNIVLKEDRLAHWFSQGAQPTDIVTKLLARKNVIMPDYVMKKIAIKKQNYTNKPSKKSQTDSK